MKLQSDPTIIYGITKGYPLGRGIRESEIAGATPYNTYVIAGPAAGADLQSRQGFAWPRCSIPKTSNDLYFVANGKGGHVFAATMAEHARNVAAWRAIERAEGRRCDPRLCDSSPKPRRSIATPRQGDSGESLRLNSRTFGDE